MYSLSQGHSKSYLITKNDLKPYKKKLKKHCFKVINFMSIDDVSCALKVYFCLFDLTLYHQIYFIKKSLSSDMKKTALENSTLYSD